VAAIEAELRQWDANPDWVRRLVGWPWIMDTLNQRPRPGHLQHNHIELV
jgi:hypothetical protein